MLNCAKILSMLALLCVSLPVVAIEVSGAGSSAAKPLYTNWAQAYHQTADTVLTYDAAGSSAGVKKISARSVDFGASDVAMSPEDSDKANLICFPTSVSGVVPFVNLPGIKAGQLNLNGNVLADIFSGKIKYWNDERIAVLNPDRQLPEIAIHTVVRSDGSGTTYNFSDYLSKVSVSWKETFGTNFMIHWPETATAVKGSDGVVAQVEKNSGSIGYVDYAYIADNQLDYVKLQNSSGKFVAPTFDTFSEALTNSDWKTRAAFAEMLTNRPGPRSWPITAGTFVLIPKVSNNPERTIAMLKFFSWSFMHGDEIARKTGSVRLTDSLQAKIFALFMSVTDKDGKKLVWTIF